MKKITSKTTLLTLVFLCVLAFPVLITAQTTFSPANSGNPTIEQNKVNSESLEKKGIFHKIKLLFSKKKSTLAKGGTPPSNDHCSNALWLTPNNYCISNYNAYGATQSLPASNCSGITSAIVQDVWFKFVATDVNQYIEIIPSSGYDPVLEVREGPGCNGTFIDCIDNGGGDGYKEYGWLNNATVGQTYYVRVYHYEQVWALPTTNTFSICVNLSPSQEDIYITNETVSTNNAACGDQISVSCTQNYVGNVLDANLPSFRLQYYLSTNTTLQQNIDILLGDDSSSLGSDDPNHNETESVVIPANTAPGNYYILFFGDADNDLAETNENNNVESVPIQITCGGTGGSEDIYLSNMSLSTSSVSCGGTLTMSCTQHYSGNQLDANLPSFDLDYYLSTNTIFDASDVFLSGDISSLGSDDPYHNESDIGTIPANTAPGSYYILFIGDADNELAESNENNNIGYLPLQVTCAAEDIFLTNPSLATSNVSCGGTINVNCTQNYVGNQLDATLPSFRLEYALSANTTYESAIDQVLAYDVSGLGSDDTSEPESASLTIPSSTTSGNYYILFIGDANNILTEQNEVNNIMALPIQVNCAPQQYQVATNAIPANGGNTNGAGSYAAGTSATITATANTGWVFLNWTENGQIVSTIPNYQFVVNGNHSLIANFSQNAYTITASPNINNGGTITGAGTYLSGLTATLQATPSTTWQFLNWTESGIIISTSPSYSFPVTADRTIVANFSTTTSIHDPEKSFSLNLYPNPTNGIINLDIDPSQSIDNMEAILYNVTGQLLLSKPITNHHFSIDLSTLAKGTYYLNIRSFDEGNSINATRIIQVH